MFRNCNKTEGIRYDRYCFVGMDWLEYILRIFIKGIIICYLFYDSFRMCFLLIPFAIADYRVLRKQKLERQKQDLILQFKSLIEAIANGLSAGYSLEKSTLEAKKDLSFIYSSNALIFRELDGILAGVQMNIPIEELFHNFGKRSGLEDISNFANVMLVAKRNGGNLVHIIGKTVNTISDKLSVEEEIQTMIAAKKYEERIMMLMPYGILLYLRLSNGDFFDVLYHNALGIGVMTLFLIVIHLADLWAQKIMEIRV